MAASAMISDKSKRRIPWWAVLLWLIPIPSFLLPPLYAVFILIFVALATLAYLAWRNTSR